MALPFGLKSGLTAKTIVGTAGTDGTDEYSARCLAHAVVYQKNGKPIKNDLVDERIKEQLIGTMLAGVSAGVVAIEAPAEEPKALEPIFIDEASQVTPEMLETITPIIEGGQVQMASTEQMPNEFAEIAKAAEELTQLPHPEYAPSVFENETIEENLGFDAAEAPVIDYEELLAEAEARSVDNANLKELVDALYRRFRIYTPFVNAPPQRSDISPLTGDVMNALTFGQSVQGFKTAQRTGASWNPSVMSSNIKNARAAVQEAERMPISPQERTQSVTNEEYGREVVMPNLHGEPEPHVEYRVNRRYDSPHKSAQTSSLGKESDGLDEDEVYAEPPINARTPIIRPFQINKRSQAHLEQIAKDRSAAVQHTTGFDDLV